MNAPDKQDMVPEILRRADANWESRYRALLAENERLKEQRTGLYATYDAIMELQHRIQAELIPVAAHDLLNYPHLVPEGADYRKVKALAATYELQDYLANEIASAISRGDLEPEPEGIEYEQT